MFSLLSPVAVAWEGEREVRLSSHYSFDLLLSRFWWLQGHSHEFWVWGHNGCSNNKHVFMLVQIWMWVDTTNPYIGNVLCLFRILNILYWFEWAISQSHNRLCSTCLAWQRLYGGKFEKSLWTKSCCETTTEFVQSTNRNKSSWMK